MARTCFLDLPPELRNRIYFYMESLNASLGPGPFDGIMTCNDRGNMVGDDGWFGQYQAFPNEEYFRCPKQPSITRTCQKIRQETLPIFYGANQFIIEDTYTPENEGVKTPFVATLLNYLYRIKAHLLLINYFRVDCEEGNAQQAHEIVCSLTDLDIGFKEGVLHAEDLVWSDDPGDK